MRAIEARWTKAQVRPWAPVDKANFNPCQSIVHPLHAGRQVLQGFVHPQDTERYPQLASCRLPARQGLAVQLSTYPQLQYGSFSRDEWNA